MVPMNAVRWAVLEAFERAGVTVESEDASDDKGRIVAQLKHRTVSVRFTAFSASLTGMTLVVKQNAFVKDRATSSELLEQIEQVLAENPTFARSLHRAPQGGVAASPGQ
jgi:methionyl-tRNA formyltransferase